MKTSFTISKKDIIEVRNKRLSNPLNSISNKRISVGRLSVKDINDTWQRTLVKSNG